MCHLFLNVPSQLDSPLPLFFISASCLHFLFCRPLPDLPARPPLHPIILPSFVFFSFPPVWLFCHSPHFFNCVPSPHIYLIYFYLKSAAVGSSCCYFFTFLLMLFQHAPFSWTTSWVSQLLSVKGFLKCVFWFLLITCSCRLQIICHIKEKWPNR